MKIYLVRHGKTDSNEIHCLVGQKSNIDINERGIIEAKELREKLKDVKFDICFSSPLTRAKSTAKILVGDSTLIKEDPRIMERYLGEFEGKDKELYDIDKFNDFNLNSGEGKVEKVRDLFSRCNEFIEFLKDNYPKDATILVVSHYGCVRVMHHILSNSTIDEMNEDVYIENCFCKCYEV